MIKFINKKSANMERISSLLSLCAEQNQFANRGPLYNMLAENYSEHFDLNTDHSVTPCANAGVALEAMARLLSLRGGRKLKWIGSAFSFQNLGRGYFSDITLLDCTPQGMLDIEVIRALPRDSFDGLIVVNPFGLFQDFTDYISFAREANKFLLIDNAAGISQSMPEWPWQALSLHHTKPYGMGEGGLALTPSDASEDLYSLLNYGPAPHDPSAWFNNGKISDISCAFLIDRLEKFAMWLPMYLEQAERVHSAAASLGLTPITPPCPTVPAMSWAYLSPKNISLEQLEKSERLTFAKYYKPIANLPQATALYSHLLNIPTHPDVAQLSDSELIDEISKVII